MRRLAASVLLCLGALAMEPDAAGAAEVAAEDVGSATGLARTVSTQNDNCWADFDGDGRLDLVVMNHGHRDGAQLLTDTGSAGTEVASSDTHGTGR